MKNVFMIKWQEVLAILQKSSFYESRIKLTEKSQLTENKKLFLVYFL